MKRFKVRFNLGRGKNYLKWKITHPNGYVEYLDPDTVVLNMFGCQFKNSKPTAQKIYEGSHKVVCAWILCREITYMHFLKEKDGTQVRYNPRVTPNWVYNGEDVDNQETYHVFSVGRKLYIK